MAPDSLSKTGNERPAAEVINLTLSGDEDDAQSTPPPTVLPKVLPATRMGQGQTGCSSFVSTTAKTTAPTAAITRTKKKNTPAIAIAIMNAKAPALARPLLPPQLLPLVLLSRLLPAGDAANVVPAAGPGPLVPSGSTTVVVTPVPASQ
ncbi:Uu.00g073000.m01.CDS01 [Anthostomella pinea]|uniref:Uu.00g073000.m01.CDS01 n=1 Tax=Anthostomella pinea TaxID=933095 RepID=A0AAI8YNY6_9PEZI|nr:Uu.00g073000.m01.CDS01 [Anthostomella pinea]